MRYLWQRFLRFVIGVFMFSAGVALTVFAYSNTARVSLQIWEFHYDNIPVGMVAIIPLIVGIVLGYAYHVPAGVHDFMHNVQLGRQIHQLEKEIKELRHQLDRVLVMPEAVGVIPAALPAPERHPSAEAALEAEPVVVHEVKHAPVHRPAHAVKSAPPEPARPETGTRTPSNGHSKVRPAKADPVRAALPAANGGTKHRRETREPEAAGLPAS
jgi:uncharacterized integral membrane protein